MNQNPIHSTDYIILGAGIAGLLCAEELKRAGRTVQLIEKGRGVGGRMATRRVADGRFDHGAQYFTAREPLFQAYVDQWLKDGVIKEWFRRLPEDRDPRGYPRYCGVNGMTDVAKHLARNHLVHLSERVRLLNRTAAGWKVATDSGNRYHGRHLVITAPLPQTMELLDANGVVLPAPANDAFRAIHYEKGLATLALLDGPSGMPEPGGMKVSGGILSWIADNQLKGVSPNVAAVTLHADPAFAKKHWDSPDEERGRLMLDAAATFLRARVLDHTCHRWGFAIANEPWPERAYSNEDLQLTLAGDSFGGPRVEGAALSGLTAAARCLGATNEP